MAKRYRSVRLGKLEKIKGWNSLAKRLRLKSMGLTITSFPSGKDGEYPHPHSHATQEEVYLLMVGRGDMIVDGRIIPMQAGDIVAVDPPARRALRSSPRSPSTWLIVGAAAGNYREDDWTEYDEPAFPNRLRRKSRRKPARPRRREHR
jgi:mannose-6-phosphate isomerase-like protein (cupin superfamily)